MTAMTDAERPWVQKALASILSQTVLPDAVILMIETGNSWMESDIDASGFPESAAGRIQIHRMPLARLGAVRNAGTRLAATRWVAYLDGDDMWKPRRIEWQLEAASARPNARFIGGDFVFIDSADRPFAFSNGSTPTPSSWLVDREMMLNMPFDPDLKVGEDYFWLKATRTISERVRVSKVVTGYRIRGMSLSSLQHGHSQQRKVREAMARAAANPLFRYPMLAGTFVRYWLARGRGYDV
jgi:glycosyltransferase involved in cell wall biosynthesis